MIGYLEVLVVDCPDPGSLARFYAELLGAELAVDEDDWAELVHPERPRPIVAFQKVENYRAPEWPGQDVPQQMHMDVIVDDLDAGEAAVLAIGATKTGSGSATYRVYLDPAGHPFCLIRPQD